MWEHQEVIRVATVREVTRHAAVASHVHSGGMVVNERTLLVTVTTEAEPLAVFNKLAVVHSRVRIMAGIATHGSFIDRVMGPHVELRTLLGMARVAEFFRCLV